VERLSAGDLQSNSDGRGEMFVEEKGRLLSSRLDGSWKDMVEEDITNPFRITVVMNLLGKSMIA
jgi:hypothetical protein